jgi:hypothetical protein
MFEYFIDEHRGGNGISNISRCDHNADVTVL